MKWDLKKPCTNCPFQKLDTAIRFACRERAEEIEEIAYRQGFVCHEFGEDVETGFDGESHIDFRADGSSQHCAGAIMMYLYDGSGNVPWENISEAQQDRLAMRLDWENVPHYKGETEFLDSYGPGEEDED